MRWIRALENAILVFLLFAMMGVAAYQVLARNLFDTGLVWGDALARVLVLWVALFGAMVASRKDDHIRIDLASRLLPPHWQRPLQRLTSLATAILLGLFAWASFEFVRYEYEDQTIAFASVPAWVCEAVMPFGAAVMCLRYLMHVINPPSREPS